MKEIFEFRINNKYAHLLLQPITAKNNGSNTVINITRDNPNFELIKELNKKIREENDDWFFIYSAIKRKYTDDELNEATLLSVIINSKFEPAGEECGTIYDEKKACEICGANRKRIGVLKLKKGSLPYNDVASTIAGEIVVSEKFAKAFKKTGLEGASFEPVKFINGTSNYYSLEVSSAELPLTENTIAGINIFDLSDRSENEIYKCPKGHTIGLNLLSEAYVENLPSISENDFFASRQKLGVNRGLLRPEPLYFCSHIFKKMVDEEKLTGLTFQTAHIER